MRHHLRRPIGKANRGPRADGFSSRGAAHSRPLRLLFRVQDRMMRLGGGVVAVEFLVDGAQVRVGDVGINLGGGDIAVAQHGLHGT